MARTVGNELMTRYVVGFEVAGLLLTVALVGAIALAHREEDEPDAPSRGEQPARRASITAAPGGTVRAWSRAKRPHRVRHVRIVSLIDVRVLPGTWSLES